MRFLPGFVVTLSTVIFLISTAAADSLPTGKSLPPAWRELGGAQFSGWTGLEVSAEGGALKVPGETAAYRVPDGPKGWHLVGLLTEHDGTIDVRPWHGLRFEVRLEREDAPLVLDLNLSIPPENGRHNLLTTSSARVQVRGKGWHTITLPFASFDYPRGQVYFLKFLQQLTLQGHYDNGNGSSQEDRLLLRNVKLVRANVVSVEAPVRSAPDTAGSVAYPVTLTNCSEAPQIFALTLQRRGWEGMNAEVTPTTLSLEPGQSGAATLRVTVPAELPAGAREPQTLMVTPQGDGAAPETLEFISLRRLPSPYLVFTEPGWEEVRAKAAKYEWAKTSLAQLVAAANAFEVPTVPAGGISSDQGTQAVFKSYLEGKFWPCALAWKLTGDRAHAEKIAMLLRRLADPRNGYPVTLHAVSQGIPQEGGFFEACARSYDLIRDAGVLSEADKQLIEQTFRLYIRTVEDRMGDGGISNWSVFNLSPAAQCALAIQDMAHFNYLMDGPCGLVDHLRYGLMDDGWWYEMSLSYNLGCAEAYTNLGLATRAFGIDLLNARFPVALTGKVGLRPFEFENFLGMAFGKYGPVKRNDVTLKQMWDGIASYPDYRGIMFGMGDGHEHRVAGGPFELAYHAFRDPAYAAVIKQGGRRDLIFGVPELPAETPNLYSRSEHSDNAGIAVLRSQTTNREPREQIQAAFKYGTHGSYHGHFDRISLLSLMRYGRSFYNPETSWFGYGSYMYKWWVQVSLPHNMVVVDAKMQEPEECTPLLFHRGPMMQATAAETIARWSNPPYFGGYDQIEKVRRGDAPFVPVPEDHPRVTEVTGFTEPVRQRRLVIVTDDYVVLADDLQGEREHTFDNLLHLRGANLPESGQTRFLGHDAQFDPDPLGSGQFITNVNRYAVTAPALVHSIHRVAGQTGDGATRAGDHRNWETGGASSLSEPGVLRIDEHVLWPPQAEVALGDYAESWPVNKKLAYMVQGDGKPLAAGTFGAWILGRGDLDVDVSGVKTLQLSVTTDRASNVRNTIFWGNPVIVTTENIEIPLAQLKPAVVNVIPAPTPDRDYAGGPVRIAGTPMERSVPAEPQDTKTPGVITVDLSGINAARFKATVGGDWPVGDEEQLRKVISVRTQGRSARFLTLIEPFESSRMVKRATATDAGTLQVELTDGRRHELKVEGLDGKGQDITVTLTETVDGNVVRTESITPGARP